MLAAGMEIAFQKQVVTADQQKGPRNVQHMLQRKLLECRFGDLFLPVSLFGLIVAKSSGILQGMHPVVLSFISSLFGFHLNTTTIKISFISHCV
jgi:hypothetical protein